MSEKSPKSRFFIIADNACVCYSTNWNPVGSGILLVQIGIPISTSKNWNSDLYWI